MLPSIKARKIGISLLIGGIIFFYGYLIVAATHIALPNPEQPLLLYSNQTRHDIKFIFYQALKQAGQAIHLSVYGITDPDILAILIQKTEQGLPVYVEYDPSASSSLKKLLPLADVNPVKSKGLMHRKIILIDQAQIFLGSANLTLSSLRHHDNLILGLYHPSLAAFLQHPTATHFSFPLKEQQGELFLLPDPQKTGLKQLLESIHTAQTSISVAMFTLTHAEIAQALIQAQQRGVKVTIAVDYYTAKGASRKTIESMETAGIEILKSQGRQLLHHKWAVIDDRLLIMGSANWTKAAFSKNQDFLFFLFPLTTKQTRFLHKLWGIIQAESITN